MLVQLVHMQPYTYTLLCHPTKGIAPHIPENVMNLSLMLYSILSLSPESDTKPMTLSNCGL